MKALDQYLAAVNGINIKKIHPDAIIPEYQTEGSVGVDFHTVEDVTVKPGEFKLIRTGLAVATPPGHMFMACPRSSTYKNFGLVMVNSVGIIDQDYCGDDDEISLPMLNAKQFDSHLPKGTRFGQGVFVRVNKFKFTETDSMGDSRGGHGSTGV